MGMRSDSGLRGACPSNGSALGWWSFPGVCDQGPVFSKLHRGFLESLVYFAVYVYNTQSKNRWRLSKHPAWIDRFIGVESVYVQGRVGSSTRITYPQAGISHADAKPTLTQISSTTSPLWLIITIKYLSIIILTQISRRLLRRLSYTYSLILT